MGMFDGCLLASDIDGTLIFGEKLPEENIKQIKYFINEGGIFAVCTGRTFVGSRKIIEGLDFIGPSIFMNGALIYDCKSKEVLHQTFLPDNAIELALKLTEEYSDVGILGCADDKVYLINSNDFAIEHARYENYSYYPNFETSYKINKLLFLVDNSNTVNEVMEHLKTLFADSLVDLFYSSVTMNGEFRVLIECVPRGINKAVGIDFLLNKYSIDKENFFAIGDYYNDLPMVKNAGIGAFVEEAPDELKQQADFVSLKAKDGAVAAFIKYLIKIRKGA
ncbi:MAG: HAD family phosphatase [Ruminococcaceae bacterium]|nr:HAD family phosphatase [Oscillospiraceae bacterium]